MDENGRIEQCIIKFISIHSRSTPKRALYYVRKHYGKQATQQIISKRMFWLASKGILKQVRTYKGEPVFILNPSWDESSEKLND